MRLRGIVLLLGSLLVSGCATDEPKADASGLVLLASSKPPGKLYVHPERSIDDYDDFLVTEVDLSYAPNQRPLSETDVAQFRTMAYGVVIRQIPAAGQLSALKPGPCTVTLGVELADLAFPGSGPRGANGETTVILEFRDSVSSDPIVRYQQHRELSVGLGGAQTEGPDLKRLESTLEVVAESVRTRFRDVLPVHQTGTRTSCKGVIGEVRKAAKAAAAKAR